MNTQTIKALGLSFSVATVLGCATVKESVTEALEPCKPAENPHCRHEKIIKEETSVWSTQEIGMNVYPDVQGPVDTFRPVYKVGEKKYTAKGVGDTEKQAISDAILNMCKSLNCDYVSAAKCLMTKKSDDANGTTFEAELIGFPIYITGVETIKPKFYEQQLDGTLKPTEPEHKVIFTTNNVWKIEMLGGEKGEDKKGDEPAVISRKLQKKCERDIPYGVIGADTPRKER